MGLEGASHGYVCIEPSRAAEVGEMAERELVFAVFGGALPENRQQPFQRIKACEQGTKVMGAKNVQIASETVSDQVTIHLLPGVDNSGITRGKMIRLKLKIRASPRISALIVGH